MGAVNVTRHPFSVGSTRCPVARTPATFQLHDSPATNSVISNGSQTSAIVFTRPFNPGRTRPVDGSTAVIVTPQDGQCSNLEIKSQTTCVGAAISTEERNGAIGSDGRTDDRQTRAQIRRFASTHRYSFRDPC